MMITPNISPNNPVPISGGNASTVNSPVDVIRNAYNQGLLKPYESSLNTSSGGWRSESWVKHIQTIISDPSSHQIKEKITSCYLFALAIDPTLDPEKKQEQINTHLKSLDESHFENECYSLGEGLPAVMQTTILQHCGKDIWEALYKSFFKYSHHHHWEEHVLNWIKEVISNPWDVTEKQKFLDKIFEYMPSKNAEELTGYILLNISAEVKSSLMNICSDDLKKKFANFESEVREYGTKLLNDLTSQSKRVRLHFDTQSKRHCFLDWFINNALQHPTSDLIATGFDEKDWEWLDRRMTGKSSFRSHNLSSHSLPSLTQNWVISITKRLGDNSLAQESTSAYHDAIFWLFYSNALKYLNKNAKYSMHANFYQDLAGSFTPENFFHYHDALNGGNITGCKDKIVQIFAQQKPEKIIKWLELLIQAPAKTYAYDDLSHKIYDTFSTLKKSNLLDKILDLIFQSENMEKFQLTVFSCLDEESRKTILRSMLEDREKGLEKLICWIGICINQKGQLKSFVISFITKELYPLLNAIDKNVPYELKQKLSLAFQNNSEAMDFIDELLPMGFDSEDPIARRQLAFKKLKNNLLKGGVTDNHRSPVPTEDLQGDLTDNQFAELLFHELPKETWPFIFMYFERSFIKSRYDHYYEEKSGGGAFKKVGILDQVNMNLPRKRNPNVETRFADLAKEKMDKLVTDTDPQNAMVKLQEVELWSMAAGIESIIAAKHPPKSKGFQDLNIWVNYAAKTLDAMHNNPLISDDKIGSAMQNFYQAACETSTIYHIVQRFIEIASVDSFLHVMGRFQRAAFYYNAEGFKTLLSEAIEMSYIDKINFIADCIKAEYASGNRSYRDSDWWKEPFLKNDAERAAVARRIIFEMGSQFLSIFVKYNPSNLSLIKCLHNTDEAFCQQLFRDLMFNLEKANDPTEVKFVIFQNICYVYSAAGVDILNVLRGENYLEKIPLKKWYSSENLSKHLSFTLIELQFLQYIRPSKLHGILLNKTEKIFTHERHISFYEFNNILEVLQKMGIVEQFIDKLKSNPEILKVVKNAMEEKFIEAATIFNAEFSFSLMCQLVPDWNVRLKKWTTEHIKEEKERYLSYGDESTFPEIVKMIKTLSKVGKWEEWLEEFRADESKELQNDLQIAIESFKLGS